MPSRAGIGDKAAAGSGAKLNIIRDLGASIRFRMHAGETRRRVGREYTP